MKCRMRPSAFSSPGGNSSSRLNSVTNSSVHSRPRLSIARRRPCAWPRLSDQGWAAYALTVMLARPDELGRAHHHDQFEAVSPVATDVSLGVAAAPFAASL